ncbi:MAG: HEPN family nuclease [Bacillota bacterium]
MEQKNIEKDFVERTLHILDNYDGPYGVTLLINCLLGLIVLPKEKDFNHISGSKDIHFHDLGLEDGDIRSWGNIREEQRTVASFIRCMRNSIAHIHIESISAEGEIESLLFIDKSGFEAVLGIGKIKNMVKKFASYFIGRLNNA